MHATTQPPPAADYAAFLAAKMRRPKSVGLANVPELNPQLFEFQRDIVRWALKRGRAAIFADCGLGKTPMQLEWAKHVPGRVLIIAPLAVSQQTIREGQKFDVPVKYAKRQSEADDSCDVWVTNYERIDGFDASAWDGVVLDESSILKAYDGKTRTKIIEHFGAVPFRLACTATPAPNDFMELGNHSEFMGIMTRSEMLSMFFVHDGGETQKWRLKGHAEDDFWRWICTWAVMLRKPSDLGYDDDGFILPELRMHPVVIQSHEAPDGMLVPVEAVTLQERRKARQSSLDARVDELAKIINGSDEPWLIWCDLNAESTAAAKLIADCVEVAGRHTMQHKEECMLGFSAGTVHRLVTKPSIAGWGMNWQHCSNVAFLGLSDSYEQFYQAVRRCWRFGQVNPVDCYVITSDQEGSVVRNIERKEADAARMAEEMVKHMHAINEKNIKGADRAEENYAPAVDKGDGWTMYKGDCVDRMTAIPDESIGFTVFSPPFASLYTYSDSDRDMGNSSTHDEFWEHFAYLIPEIYRATMPGRLCSVHCMNLPTSKAHHGYIGLRDFRGEIIRAFEAAGWIYHSEVAIWKDPVTAMQRTKALGLLHKQLVKDSAMSRQGIPDYLCTFRKPGKNAEPVAGELDHWSGDDSFRSEGRLSIDLWQLYASPVWMDINPSRTLNGRTARDDKDERHICPLQLDVIHRALQLWSNRGDVVLSPFGGIGSEGYEALKLGRQFVGIELKESYWKAACDNLRMGAHEALQDDMPLFAATDDADGTATATAPHGASEGDSE